MDRCFSTAVLVVPAFACGLLVGTMLLSQIVSDPDVTGKHSTSGVGAGLGATMTEGLGAGARRTPKKHQPTSNAAVATPSEPLPSPVSVTDALLIQAGRANAGSEGARVPFYMYDDPVFSPDLCYKDGGYASMELPRMGYWCVATEFVNQARVHPWRVKDPSQARVFVVPFDVAESFATHGRCNGTAHIERVNAVFDAVAKSPWYTRSGGRDHFWAIPHNVLPPFMVGKKKFNLKNWKRAFFPNPPQNQLIQNMSIGRYCSYHLSLNDQERYGFKAAPHDWLREEERWGCTVVLPIVTPRQLWVNDADLSFEKWEKRSNFIFFRGNNGLGGGCFMKNGERARKKAVELGNKNTTFLPKKVILSNKHAASKEAYFAEIQDSQYCLVFTCDDPQTSRYFDAIAAGCIPVLINDAWRVAVAPFYSQVNYDTFMITVPEMTWMGDPAAASHLIYNFPRAFQRRRYEALLKARPEVMWRHPQSNVATRVLNEIDHCFDERS